MLVCSFIIQVTFVFLVGLPSFLLAQEQLEGRVYGVKQAIPFVRITNLTQDYKEYTDDKGNFNVNIALNDSIVFSSTFYDEKKIVIHQKLIGQLLVIELQEKTNQLDEVIVSQQPKIKEFSEVVYQKEFMAALEEGRKNDPYKYGVSYTGNIITGIVHIISWFRDKKGGKRKNKKVIRSITYEEYISLFRENRFFNDSLLQNHLKIKIDHKNLFFDFCDAKGIDSELLGHQFLLLDALMKKSREFKELEKQIEGQLYKNQPLV